MTDDSNAEYIAKDLNKYIQSICIHTYNHIFLHVYMAPGFPIKAKLATLRRC